MDCSGAALRPLQRLHQAVGVQQPLGLVCRCLLPRLRLRLRLHWPLLLEGGDGLALQVGHALWLAPGVQVTPPLVHGARVQQTERKKKYSERMKF